MQPNFTLKKLSKNRPASPEPKAGQLNAGFGCTYFFSSASAFSIAFTNLRLGAKMFLIIQKYSEFCFFL
jgi:hypothetical protein